MGIEAAHASSPLSGAFFLLLVIVLIFAITFGLAYIPANIARKKGYGFWGFYILGLFFFFIALIVTLCLSDKNQQLSEMKQAFHAGKSVSSTADELKKYRELLEVGTISQEEFENIKKKLIQS